MPIYEISCRKCDFNGEVLVMDSHSSPDCPNCGSSRTEKQMSATSSLTGKESVNYPGPGDTSCCGGSPPQGDCSGPGSCCGKTQ